MAAGVGAPPVMAGDNTDHAIDTTATSAINVRACFKNRSAKANR
jgi:hypothetical protein